VFFERDSESRANSAARPRTHEVRKLLVQRRRWPTYPLRKMQPVIIPSRDGCASTAI